MTTPTSAERRTVPGISWIGYTVLNVLTGVSSLTVIFVQPDSPTLFNTAILSLALGLLAASVAATALRSGERWAWFVLWIPVLATIAIAFHELAVGEVETFFYFMVAPVLEAIALAIGWKAAKP